MQNITKRRCIMTVDMKTDDLRTYAIVEGHWVLWQEAIPTITETVPETSIPV